MTADFCGEKVQSRKQKSTSIHDTFLGAKSSPTCANYAWLKVAKDNAVNDESIVRTVQRNFYMDDFLKSVRTPQEAFEIYQKVKDILIKGGYNLTKWITSDKPKNFECPFIDGNNAIWTCKTNSNQ